MKLSILDQVPISKGSTPSIAIEETVKLAKRAEHLGFHRYWIAEHHSMDALACPSPEILLAHLGAATNTIRIGSGAVLLPHYKPYKVAENFNLLATLYPNRIDLGIGRAPGGSAEASIALSDNYLQQVKEMPEKIKELLHFLYADFPEDHLFAKINTTPVPDQVPEVWLLGTGEKSADFAATLGTFYAYGHFMSQKNGIDIVNQYKKCFTSGLNTCKPKILVAVSVICAETTEEAENLALSTDLWNYFQENGTISNGIPPVEEALNYPFSEAEKDVLKKKRDKIIVGNPSDVRQQLKYIQKQYNADEIMIVTITHDYKARLRSYELISEVMT